MYNCFGDVMRLRNVKGASDIISKSKYIISDCFNYAGKFNVLFGNDNCTLV